MTRGPAVRYPSNVITPLGAEYLLTDDIPQVVLRSYDDSVVFNLMGALSVCDPLTPERVEFKGLEGLISPWKVIDQKGASQDGVSFVDALYDPIEVRLDTRLVGRDPAHLRQVYNHLVASLDIKQESELSWFTHRMGRWWAPVRWFKPPDDPLGKIPVSVQELTLQLRADSGFWQSYPNVVQFRFSYEIDFDGFNFITAPGDPVTNWTLAYSGAGSGVGYTDGDQFISTLVNKTVVARRTGYTSGTANQIVEVEIGTGQNWYYPTSTAIDLWIRMNNTGTAGLDGIRCRIEVDPVFFFFFVFSNATATFSSFTGGVETVIRQVGLPWGPQPGEKFRLVSGVNEDPGQYSLLRNGAAVVTVKESGSPSFTDSAHRKAGFGMAALSGAVDRPMGIRSWSVGDNTTVTQEGFVERINVGDQPMWDRFTCFGPGLFKIGNGPNSTDMVEFGPLLPNQIMQIRTDPRKRSVVDMTMIPPSPQELNFLQEAIKDFLEFVSLGNVPPLLQTLESLFGILPPQGNPYSLLHGRFSIPVPARSPGNPVQRYHTRVSIDDGNAESQIIVAGTPLRRLPF